MASFVVMEPATVPAGTVAGDARLIKDGFSLIGFIAPPVWLLWHGLVAEAAVAFAFMLGITAGAEALALGPAGSLLSVLFSICIGFEGSSLRIARLARRGWREAGVIDAETLDEAEIRYAEAIASPDYKDKAHVAPSPEPSPLRPTTVSPHSGPALGLLTYPG